MSILCQCLNISCPGWNELLIAGFSHRSIVVKDGILLATGLHVHRSSAHQAGVGTIFDRVLTELVAKMREMKMDKTELGCLRAIVLFNPGKIFSLCKLPWNVVLMSLTCRHVLVPLIVILIVGGLFKIISINYLLLITYISSF